MRDKSAVCAHCAHDRPVIVNCAVHCLGHCSGSLFMDTVHEHCSWTLLKKSTKNDPREFGASHNGSKFEHTYFKDIRSPRSLVNHKFG